MGIAVLRAQDFLEPRFPMKTFCISPGKSGRESTRNTRSGRGKRSPLGFTKKQDGDLRDHPSTKKTLAKNLVMERVTILKRGEEMKSMKKSVEDQKFERVDKQESVKNDEVSLLCSTDRLGPEPEMVPKLTDLKYGEVSSTGIGNYAGSAFFLSPSPSSLPFPAFFKKKDDNESDIATKDLRRLLRLDL